MQGAPRRALLQGMPDQSSDSGQAKGNARMAEFEKTRVRERESPEVSSYELALKQDREFAERQMMGRIVVREEETQQKLTRQGRLRTYLGLTVKDTPLQNWVVFTH